MSSTRQAPPLPAGWVSAGASVVAMARKVARKGNGLAKHPSGLTIRNARIERARPFKWAWNQRVLIGYLNLQIGEEGIGKGNVTAWQAARITRGELPGDLHSEPRRVAFIGDEDSWDHIWVPRLKAAGADLGHVEQITSGPNGVLDVRKDADAIGDYIKSEQVALVYFDQLLDNLGYTDTWKDKQVRDALTPLIRVAQDTDCALLASMHPNKRGGSFRDRISGSSAFNALSRSSLLVTPHPEEPGRVVVVRPKGNYSVEPPAFEFRIEEQTLTVRGRSITTSRIPHAESAIPARREQGLRLSTALRVYGRSHLARGPSRRFGADAVARRSSEPIRRMRTSRKPAQPGARRDEPRTPGTDL